MAAARKGARTTVAQDARPRAPSIGDTVMIEAAANASLLPMIVSHVNEDDGTVNGVVVTALPAQIGHSKPVVGYTRIRQGNGFREWRWPE